MRKWQYVAIATALVGGIGGYWYFSQSPDVPHPDPFNGNNVSRLTKQRGNDLGNAEESDAIEPLIVDHGAPPPVVVPVVFEGPLPRVEWAGDNVQPPRPDAAPGRVRRMPYADEVVLPVVAFDPIRWILESTFPDLPLFGDGEESEMPEPARPIWHPDAYPHCPRTNECPIPARYR